MSVYQPFDTDSYLRQIEATVTQAHDDRVVLDRTVFHPKGGGQAADHGKLFWAGGQAQVVDVRYEGDLIWHILEGPTPRQGEHVRGELDWERRHALMKGHTATHILCGVIWRDYRAAVTGAEIDVGKARMDFEFERMSVDFAAEIETKINAEVEADREVRIHILPREEALAIPDLIRNKVSLVPEGIDRIRVVEIVGLDVEADGGTHVARTGEVGAIRIVGHESKGRINKRFRLALSDA
jgi:misacylated tRNA(Ala) deacylase